MPKNKESVLVTGGAGFIGGHLVDALIKDGFRVRVLDNLAPPTHNGKVPDWFNKKAQFIKGDVRSKKDWQRALKGVSCVFHLAAYMDWHPDFSVYTDTNVSSVALLFEVIVEKSLPIKKIIYASSQSVYGEGKYFCRKHGIIYPLSRPEPQLKKGDWQVYCPYDEKPVRPMPQKENDLLMPANPYGISKKAGEELLLYLSRLYKIPSVALRYSIVHGPRQTLRHFYSGALRQLAVMALSGESFKIHEDGRQSRDFINIHDLVRAHLLVLKDPKALGVYNVGSGNKTTILNLIRILSLVAGQDKVDIRAGVYRVGTPRHSIMNINKIKNLDWRPKYSLEDSVREYVGWLKNYPKAKQCLNKAWKSMERTGILKHSTFENS